MDGAYSTTIIQGTQGTDSTNLPREEGGHQIALHRNDEP